jgi:DNA-binding transcriptional LysR family regulator
MQYNSLNAQSEFAQMQMHEFDWNDLRDLLAIARAGSLAGAARALGVNHSTLFRRLNACEARLGVRVFDRRADGYVLTREGEAIRGHAEVADNAVQEVARQIAGRDFRLAGELRLTTAPSLAHDYVAPLLPGFRRHYPDIRVELAVGDQDFDLSRREADLALRATRQPPPHLVGRRVLDLPWFACASPAYLRRRGTPTGVAGLGGHDLIGADRAFQRVSVFEWQQREFADERIVARSNDLDPRAAMAEAGLGIALLPIDQHRPKLRRLFALEQRFTGGLWLLTHADLRHTARVKALSDYLAVALRGDKRLRAP